MSGGSAADNEGKILNLNVLLYSLALVQLQYKSQLPHHVLERYRVRHLYGT